MRMSAKAFLASPRKCVTLLGMSGVGKTRLSNILRGQNWFHYSVDYRIGTRYVGEAILDNIKMQAMQVAFLRELLLTDSIYIANNITFNNLAPLSTFLGKLGDPDLGGLPLAEFKRRQQLHLHSEIAALRDVPSFIDKSRSIYGYDHFLNDASGSFCEIDDQSVIEEIAQNTLMIYIEASPEDERMLIERAAQDPKPLYYREEFLDENLEVYKQEQGIEYVAQINPDHYVRWVFPRLFKARVPRYNAIAQQHGYTIAAKDAFKVSNADEFLQLLQHTLESGV